MLAEPVAGQAGHFLQRTGFLEQVRGAGDDIDALRAIEAEVSGFVQFDDAAVAAARA